MLNLGREIFHPNYSVRFVPNQRPPSANFQYQSCNYANSRFRSRNRPHTRMQNLTKHSNPDNNSVRFVRPVSDDLKPTSPEKPRSEIASDSSSEN